MDLVKTDNLLAQVRGFSSLPAVRQIGLMVMLAATIALAVAVVLWSQAPNYSILYGNLSADDLAEVAGLLDAADVPYKVEHASGSITVPSSKVHQLRIRLATQGMPKGKATGYEVLDKETAFGQSRFLEKVRFQQALEGELANSIRSLDGVAEARVHLALPKESVFVRDRVKPEASVLLKLKGGQSLDKAQIAGIVHLIAASVPKMKPENVTVVDQQGRLLSEKETSSAIGLSNTQFEYTRQLEDAYIHRIQDILSPFVGTAGIRAQVVADVDFTSMEQTRESFVPEKNLVRSEDIREEKNSLLDPMGVPGALTNKPPRSGTVATSAPVANTETSGNTSSHVVRNYELDRTIIHSRHAPGRIQRLSVGVVIDYRKKYLDGDKVESVPMTPEEIKHITALVKEAVGFDATRNDSVDVINLPFESLPQMEPAEELPLWQQPWVWELAKPLLGGLFVLWLALGVLRPTLRNLADSGQLLEANADGEVLLAGEAGSAFAGLPTPEGEAGEALKDMPLKEDEVVLSNDARQANENREGSADKVDIETARSLVQQDPKRVAQVVKTWVLDDE
ncbi:MAG TPA: flagellar basal body M-ring protein FliF [Thiolapillus brandeum]|uniref:Flagellar M-ring protein n=1 Tax=Thiolapillus brandeum TaxID=1076588 RepID=A0A831WD71_9GAMM|nr:flagellar basal body M-ring protein FliF [Thiolapillus brandeum]